MPGLVLDLPTLRAWAQGKDLDSPVGKPGSVWHCPLARYVQEHGYLNAYVSEGGVELGTGQTQPLPLTRAMIKVLRGVDRCPGEITAAQFLQILDQVEQGVA